jgi:Amt family ammonium transporter
MLKYLFIFLFLFRTLFAASSNMDTGDTAWLLIATSLVAFMSPAGLSLFYGGMTRNKNILNTIAMVFLGYAISMVVWVIWGYSLAFGRDIGGIIGSLDNIFLRKENINAIKGTIPSLLFIAFQGTFAGITVGIISGAIIERFRFWTWLVFVVLWISLVYVPVAHWVWGGGFLAKDGTLDFAGGTVVHINSGIAGLMLAILLGKRRGYGKSGFFPSSVVITVLGAALLWFGWFGFNAGSSLRADSLAALAFLLTNVSASMGALSWAMVEFITIKRMTLLGMASGAISGLVAITPAAGYVSVFGAIIIGFLSGIIGWFGVYVLKKKMKYDDSLDAFGIHGLCGIWGAVATGLFADENICGIKGVFQGNFPLLWIQIKAVIITIIYSAVMTVLLYFVASFVARGSRVKEEEEIEGLDAVFHGEKGFHL